MTTDSAAEQSTPPQTTPPAPPARRSRLGRTLVTTLTVLAVLATAVFFLGGGWFFAGRIHADALEVRNVDAVPGLTVVSATRRTITLADPGSADPLLGKTGVYGLTWKGGYGQLSGRAQRDQQGRTSRDFALLSGRLPKEGTAATLDPRAFPSTGRDILGGAARTVKVASPAGELDAWYAPAGARSRTWAILVHGKGGDRGEMLRLMRSTTAAGLPSLAITYRNDEEAPTDPSGMYQFGRTEWRDLAAAVDHATAHGAKKVVLVGASMGGSIIAAYLFRTPHAPVAGVVLDSPMLDLGATVSYGAQREPMPVFGHVPEALTWTAKRIAALRYDLDWASVDYLANTSWVEHPTLVLHGDADETVPLSTSEALHQADPDLVSLETFPGAEHVGSWNSDPARYDRVVRTFLRHL